MKLRITVLATGAALALFAASAYAAHGRALKHDRSSLASTIRTRASIASPSSAAAPSGPATGVYTAPFSSYPIMTPTYIYYPGNPNPVPEVADCATSGNNCSDTQLCDLWGLNCP